MSSKNNNLYLQLFFKCPKMFIFYIAVVAEALGVCPLHLRTIKLCAESGAKLHTLIFVMFTKCILNDV